MSAAPHRLVSGRLEHCLRELAQADNALIETRLAALVAAVGPGAAHDAAAALRPLLALLWAQPDLADALGSAAGRLFAILYG